MAIKIKELEQVLGSSARQNKYRVSFAFPASVSAVTALDAIDILAKSTEAPQKEIGIIELWNQGRKLPIPGDTTYDNTWTVSFYLPEDHQLRKDMLEWQNKCDNFEENIHIKSPVDVFSDLKVAQLNSQGEVSAEYILHGCWPSVVGPVTFDDSAENSPSEFEITFTYTDWMMV